MGTSFAKFMATVAGRVIRIVAGLGLLTAGYFLGGNSGALVAAIGAIPLAAGAFNFCVISPLIHAPFWGRKALMSKT